MSVTGLKYAMWDRTVASTKISSLIYNCINENNPFLILNINITISTYLIKTHDVIPQVSATCGSHDLDPSEVFAELNADLAHL